MRQAAQGSGGAGAGRGWEAVRCLLVSPCDPLHPSLTIPDSIPLTLPLVTVAAHARVVVSWIHQFFHCLPPSFLAPLPPSP